MLAQFRPKEDERANKRKRQEARGKRQQATSNKQQATSNKQQARNRTRKKADKKEVGQEGCRTRVGYGGWNTGSKLYSRLGHIVEAFEARIQDYSSVLHLRHEHLVHLEEERIHQHLAHLLHRVEERIHQHLAHLVHRVEEGIAVVDHIAAVVVGRIDVVAVDRIEVGRIVFDLVVVDLVDHIDPAVDHTDLVAVDRVAVGHIDLVAVGHIDLVAVGHTPGPGGTTVVLRVVEHIDPVVVLDLDPVCGPNNPSARARTGSQQSGEFTYRLPGTLGAPP